MRFTQIDPRDIDLTDERFRISFILASDELAASIRDLGLLNPPVLAQRGGRRVLVSGWKRVLACRSVSLSPIPVFMADERSDLELFKVAVYENALVRAFSAVEKAEVLSRLQGFGAQADELVRRYLPLLGIPPTREYLELFLYVAGFGPEEKRIVHDRDPPAAVLQALLPLPAAARARLLPWFWTLGQNKQKELLSNLTEIAARDGITPEDVLAHPRIRDLESDDRLSPRQQAEELVEHLKQRRNPALTTWSKAFSAALEKLGIEKGVVIDPSPFFEGEDLSLHFSFRSREEFLNRLSRLKGLADKREFQALFREPDDE
jgi:ParB family chromosome partitioning protein